MVETLVGVSVYFVFPPLLAFCLAFRFVSVKQKDGQGTGSSSFAMDVVGGERLLLVVLCSRIPNSAVFDELTL